MKSLYRRKRVSSPSRFFKRSIRSPLVLAALVLVYFAPPSHAQVRKNVLMISIVGPSHPGPAIVSDEIVSALHADPRFKIEFYWENMDVIYHPEGSQEQVDLIVSRYRHVKLDLIVLVGPNAIQLLAQQKAIFPNVPVVYCCAISGMIDQIANNRATGAWFQLDPQKRWRLRWV